MAVDKRVFQRMNSDDSPLAVPNGDCLRMVNCRVYPTCLTSTPGNTLIPEIPFTAEETVTVACSIGTGEPVTKTVTATSTKNQEHAVKKARDEARRLGLLEMVCLAWRPQESSWRCLINENGDNTGQRFADILEQYNTATDIASGATKLNAPDDADYIAPHDNLEACHLPSEPDIDPTEGIQLSITAQIIDPSTFDVFIRRESAPNAISVAWEYEYSGQGGGSLSGWLQGARNVVLAEGQLQGSVREQILGEFDNVSVQLSKPLPEGYKTA